MPPLNNNLRNEYENLFNTCNVNFSKAAEVENIIKKIITNKSRYENAGSHLGIPWYFVAVIHNMESSLSFNGHLHNGDPLTARTKRIPPGRPANGNPPFTWEESASDALQYQKLNQWQDWSIAGLLYKLEEYNGWGYRIKHPHVHSPYLWGFSNHYSKGKYIADGTWSETAVSKQCGAAVLLRRMAERGEVSFNSDSFHSEPRSADSVSISVNDKTFLKFSNKKIPYGEELQIFLNKFPDVFLKEDGKPGEKTSAAVKRVFGFYLKGDPRS